LEPHLPGRAEDSAGVLHRITTASSMPCFGFYARVRLGVIGSLTAAIGKTPTGVFAIGVIKVCGKRGSSASSKSRMMNG